MKYSILIPCYKQETLVGPCLDSVLAQEVHDWEAICTDDGSPDRTGEVLDEYVRNHCEDVTEVFNEQDGEKKRVLRGQYHGGGVIKIIHQKNKGLSGARNAAKLLSSGEWYINLDGDDLLAPDALKTLDECMKYCPDANMIRGGFRRFAHGSSPEWVTGDNDFQVIDMPGEIKGGVASGPFQAMIFNKAVCGDIILDGPNWSEERLYTDRCLVRVKKCIVTKRDIYGYREHPGQFTKHGMTLEECKGYFESTCLILDTFMASGRGVDPRIIRGLLLHLVEWQPRVIVNYLQPKDKEEAWRHWFDSISVVRKYPCVSSWCWFVSWLCSKVRLKALAMVLCYFPDWLKRKGLHR